MEEQVSQISSAIASLWGVGGGIGSFALMLVVLKLLGYKLTSSKNDTSNGNGNGSGKSRKAEGQGPLDRIMNGCPMSQQLNDIEQRMEELVRLQTKANTWLELLANKAMGNIERRDYT